MAKLTAKQSRFVDEYLVDLSATKAAIRSGYSEKTAGRTGHENLKKPEIAEAIQQRMEKRSERTQLTADEVVLQLARMGMSDIRKLFTPDGRLKAVHDLDDDTAAAVQSIEVVTKMIPGQEGEEPEVEYLHKIKMIDKIRPLELIGKHMGKQLGQWAEKHEHEHNAGKSLADLLKEVRSER
jgi:phage terminase small subunit